MAWQDWFDGVRLERGYDLYQKGCVRQFEITGNLIQALVRGSELYEVSIRLKDGEIQHIHCTCPYHDIAPCKHAVAVLCEFEEQDEPVVETENLKEAIMTADEQMIREFLFEVLVNDDRVKRQFLARTQKAFAQSDGERVNERLQQVLRPFEAYIERNGDSDYEIEDYVEDLFRRATDFIDDEVQLLVDNSFLIEAFDLLGRLHREVTALLPTWDDWGSDLDDHCYEMFQTMIHQGDPNQKMTFFQTLANRLDEGSDIDEKLIFDCFRGEAYDEMKVQIIEANLQTGRVKDDSLCSDYQVSHWLKRKITLLKEQGASWELLSQCYETDIDHESVKLMYIDDCVAHQDWHRAIALLEQCRGIFKEWNYWRRLLELYQTVGNEEGYRACLRTLILDYKENRYDHYCALKESYPPQEWNGLRHEILDAIEHAPVTRYFWESEDRGLTMAPYYRLERMDDKLLKCLLASKGFQGVLRYGSILKGCHSEVLLKKVKEELELYAQQSSGRDAYAVMASALEDILSWPGGEVLVESLVTDWQERYKRKRLLKEVLQRKGLI